VPTVVLGPDGKPIKIPGLDGGGFTGNFPVDQIAGVVHGKEYVLQAISQQRIESDHPGLLDYMNKTGKLPGYAGGGLVAGTAELRKIIGERFGISDIGGWRPEDKYGEHSTGRALDVMVGNNKAKGDAVKDFALSNASAIDLKWVIWRQHLFYPGGGGYDMPDRGSPTQNHMDHVHIFSGTGITAGLKGALKGIGGGKPSAAAAAPSVTAPDPTGISAPDQTSATPATLASSSSPSSDGGISVPSSISGVASWGFDAMVDNADSGEGHRDPAAYFPKAASAAVSGQVSSALGVLGVPDSPGWLEGVSKFVGGLSISDGNGNKIFGGGGSSPFGSTGSLFGNTGPGDGYGGAAPVSASAMGAPALPAGDVHGSQAGRQPGPAGPTYNIRTATVEDAFVQAQRKENVRLASKVDRY
jgi:hypothetical protein